MLRLFDKDMNEVEYDINSYITDIFPLENFSAFGLVYNGFYFQTGEHAFQFLKFNDSKICDEILKCRSPYEARNLGRLYRDERISKWNDVKYDYLERIFRLKVEQNPMVKQALLNTKDYTICEYCIDEDTEWGLDRNGQGENKLGKIWMKVREDLLYKENNNEMVYRQKRCMK